MRLGGTLSTDLSVSSSYFETAEVEKEVKGPNLFSGMVDDLTRSTRFLKWSEEFYSVNPTGD